MNKQSDITRWFGTEKKEVKPENKFDNIYKEDINKKKKKKEDVKCMDITAFFGAKAKKAN